MENIDGFQLFDDLKGENYASVLRQLHQHIKPRSYLEIGTLNGATLKLASCPSIAIDPKFQILEDVIGDKPACFMAQMTSDDFFSKHNPSEMLGEVMDFAFLDGMHWFEYLLRDFSNVERYCMRNSVIAIHDCIPIDPFVARREPKDLILQSKSRHPGWWAGDVWKILPILSRARPELKIFAYDADPTGLIVISNLDPSNKTLQENYLDLVESVRHLTAEDGSLAAILSDIGVRSTSEVCHDWSAR